LKLLFSLCLLFTSGLTLASTYQNFNACTAFDCLRTTDTSLSEKEWKQVRGLFKDVDNPKQERTQIKQAIALLEVLVGAKTGTWRDLALNEKPAEKKGQLDCKAEATNTTTYLRLLQQDGLLKWHKVQDYVVRDRFWLVPHWTGVIEDQTTGVKYSVDSWFRKNGDPPTVVTLERWLNKK
jgi:hypothetical protein